MADEIVEHAQVTIGRVGDGPPLTVSTDEFGDFLVDGLQKGVYNIFIQKDGYAKIDLAGVIVDKDLNLGDLAMTPERR